MKSEHNNNEMPSPEDFWPEAKDLLDNHFAKRKRVLFLFRMSFICIVSIIGLVFINKNNNTVTTNLTKVTSQKELQPSEISNSKAPVENKVKSNPAALVVNKANEASSNVKTSNNQHQDHSKIINIEADNAVIASSAKIEKHDVTSTKEDQISTIASSSTIENHPISNIEEGELSQSIKENITALPTDKTVIDEERKDIRSFSIMPSLSFKLFNQKTLLLVNENINAGIKIDDDYFKKEKKLNYFIGGYTGIQLVSKQVKSDPALTEYAAIRNTSEKKTNTVYLGLNFTIEKKGFMLQTGLNYNTIGERNNYEAKSKQWLQNDEKVWDVYNRQIIKTDTVYHFGIVNYNQTTVNVKDSTLLTKSDSVFVYNTDSNIVKANGKTIISYLEVPIMLGYQFKFGRASIAPFAGISIGYLTRISGMYINKTITGIEQINSAGLITSFNFNYQIKVQLAYNLNDHLMLLLIPQFSNNMFSVSSKSSGLNTKYSALGTSFGLSYKL